MKRMLLSMAALCSGASWIDAWADDAPAFEHTKECGDPRVESMAWRVIAGIVVEIVDGDTIVVLTDDDARKRVDLAAVDASASDEAGRALLTRRILNRRVDVLTGFSDVARDALAGVVREGGKDVNRELLEAGAARYREPAAYTVSNYTGCVYRIVENQARDAKRGAWTPASR